MKQLTRQSTTLIVVLALFVASAVWVGLGFWRSNRISAEFYSASQGAYRGIRKCEQDLKADNVSFLSCIDYAEKSLTQSKNMARTHRERIQYALLGSYLRQLRSCRKDWEQSDVSADAKERLSRLASSREDLERRLNEQ